MRLTRAVFGLAAGAIFILGVAGLVIGATLLASPEGRIARMFGTFDPDPATNAELNAEIAMGYLLGFVIYSIAAGLVRLIGYLIEWWLRSSSANREVKTK